MSNAPKESPSDLAQLRQFQQEVAAIPPKDTTTREDIERAERLRNRPQPRQVKNERTR